MAPTYIQHNPNVPTGRAAFVDFFSKIRKPEPIKAEWKDKPALLIASGPYVFYMFKRMLDDPDNAANIPGLLVRHGADRERHGGGTLGLGREEPAGGGPRRRLTGDAIRRRAAAPAALRGLPLAGRHRRRGGGVATPDVCQHGRRAADVARVAARHDGVPGQPAWRCGLRHCRYPAPSHGSRAPSQLPALALSRDAACWDADDDRAGPGGRTVRGPWQRAGWPADARLPGGWHLRARNARLETAHHRGAVSEAPAPQPHRSPSLGPSALSTLRSTSRN